VPLGANITLYIAVRVVRGKKLIPSFIWRVHGKILAEKDKSNKKSLDIHIVMHYNKYDIK